MTSRRQAGGIAAACDSMVSAFQPSKLTGQRYLGGQPVKGVAIWRRVKKWLSDPYRPELHYMRGPGPKWREAHAHIIQSTEVPKDR
jgi:hypothetical protein